MNWTKVRHVLLVTLGLLSTFAGVVYQGQLADNQVGAGLTFGVLAGLVPVLWARLQVILGKPDRDDQQMISRLFHGLATAAGVVMPVVVLFHTKFDHGSRAFIESGYLCTLVGDLARANGSRAEQQDRPDPGDARCGSGSR